jgi:hypothetical protein
MLYTGYEHIVFLDFVSIQLTGWRVAALHLGRIAVGAALVIAGGLP